MKKLLGFDWNEFGFTDGFGEVSDTEPDLGLFDWLEPLEGVYIRMAKREGIDIHSIFWK